MHPQDSTMTTVLPVRAGKNCGKRGCDDFATVHVEIHAMQNMGFTVPRLQSAYAERDVC